MNAAAGLERFRTRDVAARVGINPATLHHYLDPQGMSTLIVSALWAATTLLQISDREFDALCRGAGTERDQVAVRGPRTDKTETLKDEVAAPTDCRDEGAQSPLRSALPCLSHADSTQRDRGTPSPVASSIAVISAGWNWSLTKGARHLTSFVS
jgi:hypothetical protein